MRRFCAVLGLVLVLASPHGAAFGQDAPPEPPVLFKADSLRHDRELGIVVASGNVQVTRGDRILLADTVSFNQRDDILTASGNVSVTDSSGEVVFAEHVELSGDFKDGIIQSIRIRLTDGSRIAAGAATRTDGIRTEMRRAVYSPCKPCKDHPDETPIWQIKAYKVVHDKARREIEYNDAFLEFFGIPIAYTPYLTHPDPTVKRKTGLLAPTYGSDSELGVMLRLPFYVNIAPQMDATLTPIVTTNEGGVLAAELRNRFVGGETSVGGSFTHASREDGTVGPRGHFTSRARFDLSDTWRAGLDGEYASDDTYLRRYDFSSADTLISRVFAERFRGRNYGVANAYYFQGLRVLDDQGQTPIVHPQIDYNYIGEPDGWGGRWSLDWNLLALTRTEGTDSRRLSLKSGWTLPHTSSGGALYTVFATLQTDGYWVDEFSDPDNPNQSASGFAGRAFPQVGLDWRLPLARNGERFSQVVEPIFGVVAAPNGGNPALVPNEDSLDFELDDTNIFSPNRFTGLDRVEGGKRIYYGIKAGVFGKGGGSSSFFIGQSYRFREDGSFNLGSGLEDKFSDIIGRVALSPAPYLNLLYRFRLDKDELRGRRNEVTGTVGADVFRLSTTYTFVDQNTSEEFGSREELSSAVTSRLSKRWEIAANTRRDLTPGGGSLNHGVRVSYLDDCIKLSASFARTFTRDRDVRPSDTFLLRIELRTLGSVGAAARP